MASSRPYGLPESINDWSGSTNVSTLAVLKAFANLGSNYHTLLFCVQNLDLANSVTVIIETSEDGIYPDALVLWTLTCPAQKQVSLEVGPGLLRRFWRISAHTASPGFPTVPVTWTVRGVHRST